MFRREIKNIFGQLFEIFENQNFLISIFFKKKIAFKKKRSNKYIIIENTLFTVY